MATAAASAAVPPALSVLTVAELAADSAGPIWNELLQLARQPGVCNLGQGYPDYAGSRVAREAAAEAMITSEMVGRIRALFVVGFWLLS